MNIEVAIRETINEYIQTLNLEPPTPELISVEEAAKICLVHRSVIDSLVKERQINRFPAVKFSERSTKVDKRRLYLWIEAGGLEESE